MRRFRCILSEILNRCLETIDETLNEIKALGYKSRAGMEKNGMDTPPVGHVGIRLLRAEVCGRIFPALDPVRRINLYITPACGGSNAMRVL